MPSHIKSRKPKGSPSNEAEVNVPSVSKAPESAAKIASVNDSVNTKDALDKPVVPEVKPLIPEKIVKSVPEPSAASSSPSSSSFPSSDPEKRPNRTVLGLYRQLFLLRKLLQVNNPKLAATRDRFLASVGYPAKLLGYLFSIKELSKLSSTISDYRTFYRVITTPATLQWTLDLLLHNKNPDKLDRIGDYIQAIAGSVYQILEDLAYFASKGVLRISDKRQGRLWAVSSMFWAVHVFIELLRIPYYYLVHKKPVDLRTLVVNLAWAPLTIHWSTETGLCNDGWVGLLGTFACWPNMVYQWKQASI